MPPKEEEPVASAPPPLIPEDLSTITDKELGELETRLLKDYGKHSGTAKDILAGKAKGSVQETAAAARAAVEALTKVRDESGRRAQERDQIAAELGEMDALVTPPEPEEPEEPAEPESAEEPEMPEAEVPPEPGAKPVPPKPKAIAASAKPKPPSAAVLQGQPVDPARLPEVASAPPVTITAAGDVPHFSAGQTIKPEQLGHAMTGKIDALFGPDLRRRPSLGQYHVATLTAPLPPERALLASASAQDNHQVIERYMGTQALQPILAAGGICNPVAVDYGLTTLATRVRPIRDSLTTFQADRGGIRYMRNARLSNVSAGVDVITEAEDAANATKPCVTVTCPDEVEVLVDAVTLCITVGNFDRRFFPEHFAQWYDLARAQHARVAEQKILDAFRVFAQTDLQGGWSVRDAQNLGMARDILESYDRAAFHMRSRNRMSQDTTVQVWLPESVPAMIRSDLLREHPGASTERLNVQMAQIAEWWRTRNISVTYYKDQEAGTGQISGFQGGGDPESLLPWPQTVAGITTVVGYMTLPGLVGFLDGGTLDLGIDIRDSTLIAANNVQAFMETFEGVFWRGLEFGRIENRVCVSGETAAAIDFTCGAGS